MFILSPLWFWHFYSEVIKQVVRWWTKCIVKQGDCVEKLCCCKISALVFSLNMKHTVQIIIDSPLYMLKLLSTDIQPTAWNPKVYSVSTRACHRPLCWCIWISRIFQCFFYLLPVLTPSSHACLDMAGDLFWCCDWNFGAILSSVFHAAVFWNVTPCSMVETPDVEDVRNTSLFYPSASHRVLFFVVTSERTSIFTF